MEPGLSNSLNHIPRLEYGGSLEDESSNPGHLQKLFTLMFSPLKGNCEGILLIDFSCQLDTAHVSVDLQECPQKDFSGVFSWRLIDESSSHCGHCHLWAGDPRLYKKAGCERPSSDVTPLTDGARPGSIS